MDKISSKDVTRGMNFGELTVLYEDIEAEKIKRELEKNNHRLFRCACSCGNETTVDVFSMIKGTTRSCGHLRKEVKTSQTKDLLGMKFNNLSVLRLDENRLGGNGKHAYWICKCEACGVEKSIRSSDIISGNKIDCGCTAIERMSNANTKDLLGEEIWAFNCIAKR